MHLQLISVSWRQTCQKLQFQRVRVGHAYLFRWKRENVTLSSTCMSDSRLMATVSVIYYSDMTKPILSCHVKMTLFCIFLIA